MSKETLRVSPRQAPSGLCHGGQQPAEGSRSEANRSRRSSRDRSQERAALQQCGQHYNHLHFWNWMKPMAGDNSRRAGEGDRRRRRFDRQDEDFIAAGVGQFGSGVARSGRQGRRHEDAERREPARARRDADPGLRVGALTTSTTGTGARRLRQGVPRPSRELGIRRRDVPEDALKSLTFHLSRPASAGLFHAAHPVEEISIASLSRRASAAIARRPMDLRRGLVGFSDRRPQFLHVAGGALVPSRLADAAGDSLVAAAFCSSTATAMLAVKRSASFIVAIAPIGVGPNWTSPAGWRPRVRRCARWRARSGRRAPSLLATTAKPRPARRRAPPRSSRSAPADWSARRSPGSVRRSVDGVRLGEAADRRTSTVVVAARWTCSRAADLRLGDLRCRLEQFLGGARGRDVLRARRRCGPRRRGAQALCICVAIDESDLDGGSIWSVWAATCFRSERTSGTEAGDQRVQFRLAAAFLAALLFRRLLQVCVWRELLPWVGWRGRSLPTPSRRGSSDVSLQPRSGPYDLGKTVAGGDAASQHDAARRRRRRM